MVKFRLNNRYSYIVLELLYYIFDLPMRSPVKLVNYLVLLGAIIWASKSFRDMKSGGFISYGKSFSIGFMIALVAVILIGIYTFIFATYIDPDLPQKLIDLRETELYKQFPDWSDTQIKSRLAMEAKMMTPAWMAIWGGLIGYLLPGLLISLITSIFIKREEKLF